MISEVADGLSLKTRIITVSENELRKKKRQGLKTLDNINVIFVTLHSGRPGATASSLQ